jgi:hypothetical protein
MEIKIINSNLVTYHNPFSGFVNSAYATSCNCGGTIVDLGFKYKIDSLVITSNQAFKGIATGNNLSNLFTANFTNRLNGNSISVTIPQLIDSLNSIKYVDDFSLITTANNVVNKTHKFSYKLYCNSKVYEALGTRLVVFQ